MIKYWSPSDYVPEFPTEDHYKYVFEVVRPLYPVGSKKPRNPYDFLYRYWINSLMRLGNDEKIPGSQREIFITAYEMLNNRDRKNPLALNRRNVQHVDATFARLVELTS